MMFQDRLRALKYKDSLILDLYEAIYFNVWVRHFVWNFKGTYILKSLYFMQRKTFQEPLHVMPNTGITFATRQMFSMK